jgi:hypothetical protein
MASSQVHSLDAQTILQGATPRGISRGRLQKNTMCPFLTVYYKNSSRLLSTTLMANIVDANYFPEKGKRR